MFRKSSGRDSSGGGETELEKSKKPLPDLPTYTNYSANITEDDDHYDEIDRIKTNLGHSLEDPYLAPRENPYLDPRNELPSISRSIYDQVYTHSPTQVSSSDH